MRRWPTRCVGQGRIERGECRGYAGTRPSRAASVASRTRTSGSPRRCCERGLARAEADRDQAAHGEVADAGVGVGERALEQVARLGPGAAREHPSGHTPDRARRVFEAARVHGQTPTAASAPSRRSIAIRRNAASGEVVASRIRARSRALSTRSRPSSERARSSWRSAGTARWAARTRAVIASKTSRRSSGQCVASSMVAVSVPGGDRDLLE